MAKIVDPPTNISHVDVIMRNIFQHLNTQDLASCLQAFDRWERDIEIEKRNRLDVYPFLWTWLCKEHGKIDGCYEEEENPRNIHDDIRMKVGMYSSRLCVPLLFCTDRVVEDAEILFPGIQPTVVTDEYRRLSKSKDLDDRTSAEVNKVKCQLRQLVIKALRGYFPCSPQIILSTETELMGCGEDLKLTNLSGMSHAIAGFIIPQYPGFEIHNFEIPTHNDLSLIPVDANIKGLLVFSDEDITCSMVMHLVHTRRIYEIAVGGYKSLPTNVARNGSIVAFCGENVETASLVVSPYDEGAERKLRLFQKTTLLMNICFAFVFNSFNVEEKLKYKLVETFTQLYPNIPLAGLTTSKIYGVDYLPDVSEEIKTSLLDTLLHGGSDEYTYEYTSVFILVSIKS